MIKLGDKKQGYKVLLTKDRIEIRSTCHDEKLISTEGQDLNKDHGLLIEEGEATCRYCKKEMPKIAYPEVAVKIFEVEKKVEEEKK